MSREFDDKSIPVTWDDVDEMTEEEVEKFLFKYEEKLTAEEIVDLLGVLENMKECTEDEEDEEEEYWDDYEDEDEEDEEEE